MRLKDYIKLLKFELKPHQLIILKAIEDGLIMSEDGLFWSVMDSIETFIKFSVDDGTLSENDAGYIRVYLKECKRHY